jgi:FAD:protein FMN transferase
MSADTEYDLSFRCMGSQMRILVGGPLKQGLPSPETAARTVRRFLERFDARLSRFKQDSELSALNRDPRRVVPAPSLMRDAVRAAVWAAERTGGLVDPTLIGELELAGYGASRDGVQPASVEEAIAAAPPRHHASPSSAEAWRRIRVDDDAGTIERPPGVRLDTGGTGKGLAADMAADLLGGYSRFVVDCGGDLRVGGSGAAASPYRIEVEHPLTGGRAIVLRLAGGAVATSGINVRIWRTGKFFSHHLLDPETGEPAWTGLVGVTALGSTAVEAETLAKAALLSGPERARRWLADLGGVLVHETGEVEYVGLGEIRPPQLRFRLPENRVAA